MNSRVPPVLMLLAHDLRWQIVNHLASSDHRVGELVTLINEPQNLVSYHLKKLRESHLVNERRSSADARDVYYNLNLDLLRDQFASAGSAIHPVLNIDINGIVNVGSEPIHIEQTPVRVLFLCTHNSARSQMAEALLRHISKDVPSPVQIFSAGTEPAVIHPLAIRALNELGVDSTGQYAKSLDTIQAITHGQPFDYVVTVCDRAREQCPPYPHSTIMLHWSLPDPVAAHVGLHTTPDAEYSVFQQIAAAIQARTRHLLSLVHAHTTRQFS